MKTFLTFLGSFIVSFCAPTSSSELLSAERGNGGRVVVCPQHGTTELLDIYEGRTAFEKQFTPQLEDANLPPVDKVRLVIDRIAPLDPARAERYLSTLTKFMDQTRFVDAQLASLDDVGIATFPRGCELKQIALQKKPTVPGQKLYTIDKMLWDNLDNNNKAGLILHEIIYAEAKERNHDDSQATRYLTARLLDGRSYLDGGAQTEGEGFEQLIRDLNFIPAHVAFKWFRFAPSSIERDPLTQAIVFGRIADSDSLRVRTPWGPGFIIGNNSTKVRFTANEVATYQNAYMFKFGVMSSFVLKNYEVEVNLKNPSLQSIRGVNDVNSNSETLFEPFNVQAGFNYEIELKDDINSSIEFFYQSEERSIALRGNYSVRVFSRLEERFSYYNLTEEISFYPSGRLRSGRGTNYAGEPVFVNCEDIGANNRVERCHKKNQEDF